MFVSFSKIVLANCIHIEKPHPAVSDKPRRSLLDFALYTI